MATFYNKATLSYNNGSTDSNIVTGELIEVLSATKTALESEYDPNGTVTYLINIVNSGSTPYTGLTVSDDLGTYDFNSTSITPLTYVDGSVRYFSNGTLQAAPAAVAGPPLTFTGINVPANGNALLIYKAAINEYAPLGAGSQITNTATVNGASLTSPITATATIPQSNKMELSIGKTMSPETVVENGDLTYTFVIQNSGSAAASATENVTVTDVFDPVLKNLTVTLNGTPLAETTGYTYDDGTGLFRTVAGQITVPAATYTTNPTTGARSVVPGVAVLKVTGTI